MFKCCTTLTILFSIFAGCVFAQGLNTNANKDDWEEINFEFNSAILSDGYPSLLRIADLLNKNPGYRVKVEGNTDSIGSVKYNEKLAMRRADTVKSFLLKYGAKDSQVETAGHGKGQPKVENRSKEGRFMNRRVTLTVFDAQGRVISNGSPAEAIKAMAGPDLAKLQECCDNILKKLDKLDDILNMLKGLNDANAGLKRELADLRNQQEGLRAQVEGMPKPLTKPEVTDITRSTTAEVLEQSRMKRFSLLGVNVGSDDSGHVTFTGKGRFFAPFKDKLAVQSEAEYLYFHDRQEGQFDLGLVDRFTKKMQAGLFTSFKHVDIRGMQEGGTLGQASMTLDYLFSGGRLGLFASKGFMNDAVINRRFITSHVFDETYLRTIDQIGVSTTIALGGKTYLEGNLGYLKSRGYADRPGGTLRFVQPVTDHLAVTLEGGFNETLLGPGNTGRVVAGVMFGNFLKPKDYMGVDHPVPAEIPRVRYEVLTRRIRNGNDPPVADAGPDQIGVPAGVITLDGSGSFDPDGDPITYQWTQIAGPTVAISGATSAKATFTATDGQNYSFRLTVTDNYNGKGIARVNVSTAAALKATINSFTANPTQITAGQSSTLAWNVVNADTVNIAEIGNVQAIGTASVSPTTTTTYHLTATNKQGSFSATVTVTVQNPQARLLACTATPTNITAGESSLLTWATDQADTVSINNGIGTVATNGNTAVSPTANTTYTITATNKFGSTTCQVTVQVTPGTAPRIVKFAAAPLTIQSGQVSTLVWATDNTDTVSISTVGSVPTTGTSDVHPTTTTTYTLTATNKTGSVTATVTVTVSAAAPNVTISGCTATPAVINIPGLRVRIDYLTIGAESLTVAGGPLPSDTRANIGLSDINLPVFVQPYQTTTYTLTAYSASGGQASCSVTITLQ